MMKKKRIVVFGVLLVITALLLTACGGGGKEEAKASPQTAALKKQYADTEVGSTITFGAYEQDNDLENSKEPIEWLVLAKEGNRLLLLSKSVLAFMPYNNVDAEVTWETCTLRTWLNNDFLKAAFSGDEQTLIPTMTIRTENNDDHGTSGGNDTQDKVFLLSTGEVNMYLSGGSKKCEPTVYAKVQGDWSSNTWNGGYCWWWLRGPGGRQDVASGCSYDGATGNFGDGVIYDNAVRPAIWLDLNP